MTLTESTAWYRAALLPFLAIACQQPPQPMVWPVPDGLPELATATGKENRLDAYVRPGLGRGEPLQTRPDHTGEPWWPTDSGLFASGQLTVLWMAVTEQGITTWAGHDAPWRADDCSEHGCYAIEAPGTALVALAAELDVPSPPALVAIGRDAPISRIEGVVAALENLGLEAHALVSPDGIPPVRGTEPPRLQVLTLGPSASPACTGAFLADQTWADVIAQLRDCEAVHVDTLAAKAREPAGRHLYLGGLGGLTRRRSRGRPAFTCTAKMNDVRHGASIPLNAIRPQLQPTTDTDGEVRSATEIMEIRRCANQTGATGLYRVDLTLDHGIPVDVGIGTDDEAQVPAPLSTCMKEEVRRWRFTTDASGPVAVDLEIHCSPR